MSSRPAPKPSWRSPRLGVRMALGFGALVAIVVVVVTLAVAQLSTLARHGEQVISSTFNAC